MRVEWERIEQLMRKAFRTGQKGTALYWKLKAIGPVGRKTDFLKRWRGIAGIEEKKGRLQFVRKNYLPGPHAIAKTPWELSEKYRYVSIMRTQAAPGEPITEQKVSICQDRPLTPREVEALTWEMATSKYPDTIAEIVSITPWSVMERED